MYYEILGSWRLGAMPGFRRWKTRPGPGLIIRRNLNILEIVKKRVPNLRCTPVTTSGAFSSLGHPWVLTFPPSVATGVKVGERERDTGGGRVALLLLFF